MILPRPRCDVRRRCSCLAPRHPHLLRCPRTRGAVMCSRVCHDLISPVGAIVNGLEVLDDNPKPDDREFALDLIRKSAKTASARLQFCRLAFGAAGSAGAQIDLGDARPWRAGISKTTRPRSRGICRACCCRKTGSNCCLNMMVIAQQTIPRGGVLTVDPVGEGDHDGLSRRRQRAERQETTKHRRAAGPRATSPAEALCPRVIVRPVIHGAAGGADLRLKCGALALEAEAVSSSLSAASGRHRFSICGNKPLTGGGR